MEIGWLSLIPVVLAIVLAFIIKNVFISLLVGIITSGIIIDIKTGTIFTGLNSIYSVFKEDWAVKSILFCLMIGAFVHVIEVSGGVQGMVEYLTEKKKVVKSRRGAEAIAYLLGILMFIDATSSIVISGISSRPLFDHFNVSREKLAYITDSTSSPIAWLVPFNAAGAFLMAMIGGQVSNGNLDVDPMNIIISAVPFQLYGIISILIVGFAIFKRNRNVVTEKYNNKISSKSYMEDSITKQENDDQIKPNISNMIIPLLLLIGSISIIMFITGDGSSGIYIGGIITLLLTGVYYVLQGITNIENYFEWITKGLSNYLGITLILTLAFAFSNLVDQLGTGVYIASISDNISPSFLPVMIFIIGAIMSFATGTSAGTVAILIPIVIPMATMLQVDIPITIGAIISGGVFGDHCSPISDSTILSSMVAEINVMDHVKTQMPYALISATLTSVGFIILGFMR